MIIESIIINSLSIHGFNISVSCLRIKVLIFKLIKYVIIINRVSNKRAHLFEYYVFFLKHHNLMKFKIITVCVLVLYYLALSGNALPEALKNLNWQEKEDVSFEENLSQFSLSKFLEIQSAIGESKPHPVIARNLAIFSRSIYEAARLFRIKNDWQTTYTDVCDVLKFRIDPSALNTVGFETFLGSVSYSVVKQISPEGLDLYKPVIDRVGLTLNGTELEGPNDVVQNIVQEGKKFASIMLDQWKNDGSNSNGRTFGSNGIPFSDYTGFKSVNKYVIPNYYNDVEPICQISDINKWIPIAVQDGELHVGLKHEVPQWRILEPFSPETSSIQPVPPTSGDVAPYLVVEEILDILEKNGHLSDIEKVVASVHNEGFGFGSPQTFSPAGQWMYISLLQAAREKLTNWDSILLFFIQSLAQHDAAIAAWRVKMQYEFPRPFSRIQCESFDENMSQLHMWLGPYKGFGSNSIKKFKPYVRYGIIQPASSGYVSAHSTASFAGAEVLKQFFESDILDWNIQIAQGQNIVESEGYLNTLRDILYNEQDTLLNSSPSENVILKWGTYSDLASEIGESRVLSSSVFKSADLEGRKLGSKVGALVWKKALQYLPNNIHSPNE